MDDRQQQVYEAAEKVAEAIKQHSPDVPITPAKEPAPPDVLSPAGSEGQAPREAPPPGEERPERRGALPTTPPTTQEEPPPGEERPGRRTP
jgi:hypothetical protein